MDQIRLLLVESFNAADLCGQLVATLAHSPEVEIHRVNSLEKNTWATNEIYDAVVIVGEDCLSDKENLLGIAKNRFPESPVLVVVEPIEPGRIIDLLKRGVTDFISPPLNSAEIIPRIWRAVSIRRQSRTIAHSVKQNLGLKQFIGSSSALSEQTAKIPLIAVCDASVLISGETGTGKELCARAIHYLSARAGHAFIPVNCGAVPVELVENEMFGHQRGAYTGATTSQPGLINEADGGTLFLDEIDCLPLLAQVKLLRFLQEKEYRPVGSAKTRTADVRVIAASNTDIDSAVRDGRLRKDLYYRLNTVPIALPPLRERREDIPLLAHHFLAEYAGQMNKPVRQFSDGALQRLLAHNWPGNVRELQHVVERAVILSIADPIGEGEILISGAEEAPSSFREAKARVIADFEKSYIEGLLISHRGNISSAARAANKNRRAFWQLIRKRGIVVENFKRE
jgi:DNA-binding NtrC family response regulator